MTSQAPPAGDQTEHTDAAVHEPAAAHPSPRDYIRIGVALSFVTLLEVGMYYIPGLPDAALIASLVVLMVIKFALVVLWFMHLKFDSRLYLRLFVAGLILALSVFVVAFGLFFGD